MLHKYQCFININASFHANIQDITMYINKFIKEVSGRHFWKLYSISVLLDINNCELLLS